MSPLELVGSFRIALPAHAWTWTESLFTILGIDAARATPTTELMLQAQHPDDRATFERFLDEVTTTGLPGALWHRVVRPGHDVRTVVTTATGVSGPEGTLAAVLGQVVDVSEPVRVTTSHNVDEALEQLSQTRPVIDQAKGALMITYGIDAEAAFEVLREYSQHLNIKLRDLARALIEAVQQPDGWSAGTRSLLDRLVRDVRDPASGENPGA